MFSKLLALSAYTTLAAAAVVSIDVSSSSGALLFNPNSATANMGDEVVFTFRAGGHTVVQGQGPDAACQPMANGFFAGMQSPPTTFTVQVNDTQPIWFYCSTIGHCKLGMVGVINPPQGKTVQDYVTAAPSASGNPAPNVAAGFGGTLNKNGGTSTSSTSGSPAATNTGGSDNSGYGGSTKSGSSAMSVYDIPAAFALLLAGAFAAYM